MTKKSSASKTVSHADKLQNLRVEFGRAQERARAKGSVNECSINKICKHADVPKNYLLGHRLQDGDANKTEYLKLADEINEFRETFQPSTETTAERQELIDLTKKYENLANSINPLTKKLLELEESERTVSKIHRSSVDTATMYVAKIKQLEELLEAAPSGTNVAGAMQRAVTRQIVSPDTYRMAGGRYQKGDRKAEQDVWKEAYNSLDNLLSRPLKMRLYILVGLPCSGKSTWANNADLESGRHPVVFDATNLKMSSRTQIIASLGRFEDLPKYCVYFDVDMAEIKRRNRETRTVDKQITDDDLSVMSVELEKPDPYTESWIDNLIVVRP